MYVYVANPLYDAVFKYLMEDERIAKTILSALLKKKVADVRIRRNEYANLTQKNSISMFRIDFAATVVDEDGKSRLMLIELQKTWLPTETLRFRRYLALQYNNEENMVKEEPHCRYAVPMVAIYLLGHRVGNINAPIVYVNHKAYDYDENELTEGLPDPFVDSLQHDSIIVQIPLLHGMVNNRLEKVLSIFDQSNTADNKKVIRIDDDQFEGDNDMEYMIRRLQSAAADPDMRYQMNVEDEFFTELEGRDTALMESKRKLEETNAELKATSSKLEATSSQLEATSSQLEATSSQLDTANAKLQEQERMVRLMAERLRKSGMSINDIAAMLNINESEVKEMLGE